MTGGLFDPLGTDRTAPSRGAVRPPAGVVAAGVVAAGLVLAALAALLAVSWLRDDGDRGRPVAVAPIEHVRAPPKPPEPASALPAAPPASAAPAPPAGLPPLRDDQEVEIQNGVRVVRPRRDGTATRGQTIRVPDATAQH